MRSGASPFSACTGPVFICQVESTLVHNTGALLVVAGDAATDEPAPAEGGALPGEDPAQTEARLTNDKYSALLVEKSLRLLRCMDAADPALTTALAAPGNLKALIDLFETDKWGAPMSALRVRARASELSLCLVLV